MPSSNQHPWEFGSEFHWPSLGSESAATILPEGTELYGSGRDAIRALIATGRRHRGWRRWFIPTYFCPEVTEAIAAAGVEIVHYEDSPLLQAPPPLAVALKPGDALLLVNYFGLRGAEAAQSIDLGPADLIEDHTHDPWSGWALDSRAHYCLVSLRKTLPIPGGGAVWSPRKLPLPGKFATTAHREIAVLMKFGAMILKRLYLEGRSVSKEAYRALQLQGEEEIGFGEISGIDAISERMSSCLPWESWRTRRRMNHTMLADLLGSLARTAVLRPWGGVDSCPFSLIVLFASRELRDRVRAHLIASAIYPAILWPISGEGRPELAQAERLASRVLAFACDFRYGCEDLLRVADCVRSALDHGGN